MTREESIKFAQKELEAAYDRAEKIGHKGKTRYIEVLEMVIKVLEQEPIGHWILDETDNSITCDKCGCLIWANDISNGEAYYCPNCGARMEG